MITRILCALALGAGVAAADIAPLAPKPSLTLDLKNPDDAATIGATWSGTGAILSPRPNATGSFDLSPRVGTPDFESAPWVSLAADELEQRRGAGAVSFHWYRLKITPPATVRGVSTEGCSLSLALRIDDYAEVWVDGRLPYRFSQSGGSVIAGWNATNRVPLTTDLHAGETFDVAIFAANGPISEVPTNQIWVRDARLELTAHPRAVVPQAVDAQITRFDPRLDAVLPPNAIVERVATGFVFTEGPVWDRSTGTLLFSDPNENTVYRWSEASGVSVVLSASGYNGADIAEYHQPGSNGLTFDLDGRLTIDQHGLRRVVRLEPDGSFTTLADRYHGMRLNSPNDLVYRSDGALYFTDPPFGLPGTYDDPRKETPFSGVYRLDERGLRLLTAELRGPNGLAFNHKETHLYVGDWDESHKAVMRYPVLSDGSLGPGVTFADLTHEPGDEAIDGVKVDASGNVFVCGPGGLWLFASDGARLGFLRTPEPPHNIAFGGTDGSTLYMTCHTGIYRIHLASRGPIP